MHLRLQSWRGICDTFRALFKAMLKRKPPPIPKEWQDAIDRRYRREGYYQLPDGEWWHHDWD